MKASRCSVGDWWQCGSWSSLWLTGQRPAPNTPYWSLHSIDWSKTYTILALPTIPYWSLQPTILYWSLLPNTLYWPTLPTSLYWSVPTLFCPLFRLDPDYFISIPSPTIYVMPTMTTTLYRFSLNKCKILFLINLYFMFKDRSWTLNSQLVPDYPLCGFASSSKLLLLSHWVGGLEFQISVALRLASLSLFSFDNQGHDHVLIEHYQHGVG